MELAEIMALLLYFLGAIALVLVIILLYRMLQVLDTVDKITDDVYMKSQKLNSVFDLADKLEVLNARVINAVVTGIVRLFERKKKGDDSDE